MDVARRTCGNFSRVDKVVMKWFGKGQLLRISKEIIDLQTPGYEEEGGRT